MLRYVLCVCQNKCYAISKEGRRLRFGMFTVLTNTRLPNVLWLVEDTLRWKMTFGGRQTRVEDNLGWK